MESVSDRASSSVDHSKQNNTDGIIQQVGTRVRVIP